MNWVYDNMGGSKVYAPISGVLSGYTALVEADGTVIIETPAPGGGKVAMVRGVWLAATTFPYTGFWANPEGGDLTNYFTGGSYENTGAQTTITLGAALTPGDEVQIYYFYDLETPTVKGEGVNNFPCPRKAYRGATDFTYDFAVDRIFDLMGILHAAGLSRGTDYSQFWKFLWNKYVEHAASLQNPLFLDDFERSLVGAGRHLLYNNSDQGQAGFDVFGIQLYPGDDANPVTGLITPRALRVVTPSFTASWHGAWWGYGLNWDLSNPPLDTVDTLTFKLRTARNASSVHNQVRIGYAGGNANLIVQDRGGGANPYGIVVYIDAGGVLGTATYKWSKDWGATWEATGLNTCGVDSPAHLFDNIYIWWEIYDTPNFATNDYWEFKTIDILDYPQRLLICLNDSIISDPTPWTEEHCFYAALPDIYETLTEVAIAFAQFWRRDNIVYDGDRVKGSGWGPWYAGGTMSILFATERQLEQTISGETFYTQLKIEWAGSGMTDWGMWTGLNTSEVDSTGRTGINLAVYPEISGAGTCNLRLKAKDAAGSYFYKDFTPTKNQWNRLTVALASMTLESGSAPMVHPIALIDVGQSTPDASGIFYLTDIKFDDHIVFAGPNLRTLEFKYEENFIALPPPAYWLDDISLNLEATDPYPLAPRMALSLGPNGLNPYRGPSLVHYAQPLAPYLMDLATEVATFLSMHVDAQDAYDLTYRGTKGPIMPVHTRNDIENIAILESAAFNTFCWWSDYPEAGSGLGQYWAFMRLAHYYFVSGDSGAWTILNNWLTWLNEKGIADGSGWKFPAVFQPYTFGSELMLNSGGPGQTDWVDSDSDGVANEWWVGWGGTPSIVTGNGFTGNAQRFANATWSNGLVYWGNPPVDTKKYQLNFKYRSNKPIRILTSTSDQIFGTVPANEGNAISASINITHASAIYGFMFMIYDNDAGNWLEVDEVSLKEITQDGTTYSDYDPGQTAAIAIGCLYCYMANEDSRASTWTRRILDDLRINRQSATYDYLYKSDLHYGWLNALVAHAFGLAVNGRSGSSFTFTSIAADQTHFEAMVGQFMAMAGDSKPNVLNVDLLPFSLVEDGDNWAFAPNYMMNKEYGSTEALVLMMNVAHDYAILNNDWTWFDAMLKFLLADFLTVLPESSIESITSSIDTSLTANKIRVLFGDFMRDKAYYVEEEDAVLIAAQGEKPLEIDLRYGNQIITESVAMANLIAQRGLAYFSKPVEIVEIVSWLEGMRIINGEIANPKSTFHNYTTEQFFVMSKLIDLAKKRIKITALRQIDWKT
jgi:hypothetical protein